MSQYKDVVLPYSLRIKTVFTGPNVHYLYISLLQPMFIDELYQAIFHAMHAWPIDIVGWH